METNPNVRVIDAVCGSGKTTASFDLINRLSESPRFGDPQRSRFIFVSPILMECHRVAGSIPVDIPIEHAEDFPGLEHSGLVANHDDINLEQRRDNEGNILYRNPKPTLRNFILPPKIGGKRMNGIKEAIYHNKDIVITHSSLKRFDQELIKLIRERGNYILIIDEVPEVFGLPHDLLPNTLSENDARNLVRSGNLTANEDGLVSWRSTDSVNKWDVFGKLINLINEGRIVQYAQPRGKPILFLRQYPELFKVFSEVYILTYIFEGSICKAYFDLYGITYQVESYQNPNLPNIPYATLINLVTSRDATIGRFDENSLSTGWYNKNNSNLRFLKDALHNFFNNSCRSATPNMRLWTVVKGSNDRNRRALKGSGYSKRFKEINARATNSFMEVRDMAYLGNIFLPPPLKNFFSTKGFPINEDKYALGEMLQWIFRGRLRNAREINLFLPSPRMKRLLVEWLHMQSSSNGTV